MRHATVLTLCVVLVLICSAQCETSEQREVHDRMHDLVDSVKDAVRDADAAVDKKQVVDLGQSLHLLEAKFSGLRAALAHELGASKDKAVSHAAVSRDLMEKSTELVRGVVSQREELTRLSGDLRELDSAIRAIREGLHTFEREMADLNNMMSDVHRTHHELSASNEEIKSRIDSVVKESTRLIKPSTSQRWLVVAIIVELCAFTAFIYLKRFGRFTSHKAYGKFG